MKRYTYILPLLAMLISGIAPSCTVETDEIVTSSFDTVDIDVVFRMEDMTVKSMTSDQEDASLKDVWVFQFQGSSDASGIVGKPRYYEIKDNTSRVAFSRVEDCTVVFIANTHDAHIGFSDVRTLGDIRNRKFLMVNS